MPQRVRPIITSDDKEKCKALAALQLSDADIAIAEGLPTELEEVDAVADDESLARLIEDPTHVELDDPDIRMSLACTPATFGDAFNKGLSVRRLDMTTRAEVDDFGVKRAMREGVRRRVYLGFVACEASELRNARTESEVEGAVGPRTLSVFSTPLDEAHSHADVCVHRKLNRLAKEDLKSFFWEVFQGAKFVAQAIKDLDASSQPTA
ncbi:hypothetical protein EF096_15845 [Pseudomonas neustonica]|uniref:Uncharacterized protein n=1 Tax=Pseudomonas neustonica TaxID=2487346 RepID=A0ABX9XHC7_9PSED|nr:MULTISPECIES: hypothetical protein [Pseudomonas]ROZ80933.1 hypothetical protein EF099_16310 [Pseudomonas sp. SSM44]ROZ82131.1 hypothetical protein EF096_15845 [Pseudomonas neustonica]|tara:strand:+ start:1629 stop:2252 length:624 start_codon:yes stop_codon:yes gene_type:complete